ncbi:MAG: tetratricopeptide repeat protein, partial [Bryobacteraceae bacterium]
ALEIQQDYLPALTGAAEMEYNTGSPQASSTLARLLARSPDNPTAHAMLGVLAFESKDPSKAVFHFEKAGAQVEQNPVSLWQFGQSLFLLNRPLEAAKKFEALLRKQPANDAARFNLALCRYEAKQFKEALDALSPLLPAAVPEAETLRLAAASRMALEDTEQALKLLQRAVHLYPREESHYIDLASLCLEHESYDLGLEILEAGQKNAGPSPRLHAILGVFYAELGKHEQAAAEFQRASDLAPEQKFGKLGLGMSMLEAGKIEESIGLLRKHLKENPEDAEAHYLLAEALQRMGAGPGSPELKEAFERLQKAVALKPTLVNAKVSLGKLLLKSGDTEAAHSLLKSALRTEPENRSALYQLALALRKSGRTKESADLLARLKAFVQKERQEELDKNRVRLVKAPPPRIAVQ